MMKDAELRENIVDELTWEPSVDATRIDVTVTNGHAVLSGLVPTYFEKLAAEGAVERVLGIRSIVNDINVELTKSFIRSDAEIAEAARTALLWNTTVPDENITVEVENGQTTLKGEVEWFFQKEAATEAVKYLSGITDLANEIRVKPIAEIQQAQEKIERALKRDALIDTEEVKVQVDGTEAVLEGTVETWLERRRAENIAWSTPGILIVQNNISVGRPRTVS